MKPDGLPRAPEAERAVLGGLMLDPAQIPAIAERLQPEHFHREAHGQLFRLMLDMSERGQPVEMLTVVAEVQRLGLTDAVGGLMYVATLPEAVASAESCGYFADLVIEKATARRLHELVSRVEAATLDGASPAAQIEALTAALGEMTARQAAGGWAPVGDCLQDEIDRFHAAEDRRGEVNGLPTGLAALDAVLGGLQPTDMVVIGARAAMGKTSLALGLARAGATVGAVGLFSLEMSRGQLATRLLLGEARVPGDRARKGTLSAADWADLTAAAEVLSTLPLYIDDRPGLTLTQIRAGAQRLRLMRPDLSLILVDYIGLIHGGGPNRQEAVAAASRGLKALAKELNVPVVVLAQLNRDVESRGTKKPGLADLRECLPVEEWVDTPSGPVQLKTRPSSIITTGAFSAHPAPCLFIEKRRNKTYRVSTKFGSFSATARHQVLTGTGWKQVRDLVPGRDVVACPKRIEHANRGPLPHARLLGWLIGNGCLTGTPALIYRRELDSEVRAAVAAFGVEVRPRRAQRSANVVDAYLSNGVESGSLPNPLMLWVRSLGLEGKTAADKSIPAVYMGSSDDTHRELLRGLWEADGTVTGGRAKFATCNELLARQVKWLLHTIGVRSTVSFYKNSHAGMWDVRCAAEDNERMAAICANRTRFPAPLDLPSPRYIDPAPAIFVELAAELCGNAERFQARKDGQVKCVAKSRIRRVLDEHPISTIEESPYMSLPHLGWAPVVSVEHEEPDVQVCDLSVPGTHSFLTNGLVVHNSGAIEQDADVVLLIYRDEYYNKDSAQKGEATLIIAKHRNGPTGEVQVGFDGSLTKFADLARPGQWERYK